MSQIVTNPTDMAPTINQWEINDNTFKRSQSMPPERRKRKIQPYAPDSVPDAISEVSKTKEKPDRGDELSEITFRKKNLFSGMSFRGRKVIM